MSNPYEELKVKIAKELGCEVSDLMDVCDSSCIGEGLCFTAEKPKDENLYLKPILEAALFALLTKEAYKIGFDNLSEDQFLEPGSVVRIFTHFGVAYLVLESYPWLIIKKPYNFDQYYGQEV